LNAKTAANAYAPVSRDAREYEKLLVKGVKCRDAPAPCRAARVSPPARSEFSFEPEIRACVCDE